MLLNISSVYLSVNALPFSPKVGLPGVGLPGTGLPGTGLPGTGLPGTGNDDGCDGGDGGDGGGGDGSGCSESASGLPNPASGALYQPTSSSINGQAFTCSIS